MSSGMCIRGPPGVAGLVRGVVISVTQVRFHVCYLEGTIYIVCVCVCVHIWNYLAFSSLIWPDLLHSIA